MHAYAYAQDTVLSVIDGEEDNPPQLFRRPNPVGKVVDVTDKKQFDDLVSRGPVFVDFFAPWCPQ